MIKDRKNFLIEASKIVCNNREEEYGTPENSFTDIADLWSAYKGTEFTAEDTAIMMMLLKVARVKGGRYKEDSWVDAIGYLACGAEIAANKDSVDCEEELI